MAVLRAALLALSILLVAAVPSVAQPFAGYKAMTFPQAEVPIGARWIPGVGPDGVGAGEANITVLRGLSSAVISQQTKVSLVAALGTFLGLSTSAAQAENFSFTNLEAHRVSDLSALTTVKAGEQVLSQALKAGTISIRTDTVGAAQIEAAAARRGVPVTVKFGGSGGRVVDLDGSNLFIAYQVVQLGQPQVRTREVQHRGTGTEVTIDNTYRFRFCCGTREKVIIEAQNLRAVSAGGGIESIRFDHYIEAHRDNDYRLPAYRDGEFITAARVRFLYAPNYQCIGEVITPRGDTQPLCMVDFPANQNRVRLTTSRFRVSLVPNPQGGL